MNQQTFHMENQIDAVDPMVLSLKRQVEDLLPPEALFRFEICVSEALSNLALHAKPARDGARIMVTLSRLSPNGVQIEIYDPEGADAFDPRNHATALSEVDEMAEGGRGLGLILNCADVVTYGDRALRNRLCLAFRPRV